MPRLGKDSRTNCHTRSLINPALDDFSTDATFHPITHSSSWYVQCLCFVDTPNTYSGTVCNVEFKFLHRMIGCISLYSQVPHFLAWICNFHNSFCSIFRYPEQRKTFEQILENDPFKKNELPTVSEKLWEGPNLPGSLENKTDLWDEDWGPIDRQIFNDGCPEKTP